MREIMGEKLRFFLFHKKISNFNLKTWDIRIKNKVDKWNWFYEADIEGYSSIKYESWDKNQKNMAEDMKWWIKKRDKSTFFPDSRSKEKIKDEIAEAFTNMKPKTIIENWVSKTYYWWKMSDGNYIEFQLNADGSIKSAYPNLYPDFINLFN
jgi:hypothetical protein